MKTRDVNELRTFLTANNVDIDDHLKFQALVNRIRAYSEKSGVRWHLEVNDKDGRVFPFVASYTHSLDSWHFDKVSLGSGLRDTTAILNELTEEIAFTAKKYKVKRLVPDKHIIAYPEVPKNDYKANKHWIEKSRLITKKFGR